MGRLIRSILTHSILLRSAGRPIAGGGGDSLLLLETSDAILLETGDRVLLDV